MAVVGVGAGSEVEASVSWHGSIVSSKYPNESEAAVGLTRMAKSSASSSIPDEEDGEVVEGGVGAGSAVKASVSSAVALSL